MKYHSWQTHNLEAIKQRISWLHKQPDGIIFSLPSNIHLITIKKFKYILQLVLIEKVTEHTNWTQSILNLDQPLYLSLQYTQAMMLGLIWNSHPKKVYMAGLGGGSIALFLHHYFPEVMIECAEIDPNMLEVARKFFGIPSDDRFKVKIQDGREFLQQQNYPANYDLILIDVALGDGYIPYNLSTLEFYQICRYHLSKSGVLIINTLGKKGFGDMYIKTIQSVFTQVYFCQTKGGNNILIGTQATHLTKEGIINRAKLLQESHQFSFSLVNKTGDLRSIQEIPNINLEEIPIFRDVSSPPGYFDAWLF